MKLLSGFLLFAILGMAPAISMEIPEKKANKKIEEDLASHFLLMKLICEGRPHDAMLAKATFSNNPKEAYEIYSGLADIDSDEPWHAMALLSKGMALAKGDGVAKNRPAALACFEDCYKKHNDPKALLAIGDHYEDETRLLDNYNKAASYYKKAFANGEPMAGYRMARLIYNENIKPETKSEVLEIIKYTIPAANANITEALYLLASVLLDNDDESFTEVGLPAFLQAAKNGDSFSALQLGILYKNGLHVPKDTEFAQKIFNKALNMEDTAVNKLAKAYMYKHGIGITKDSIRANKLLKEARPQLGVNQSYIDNLFSEEDALTIKSTPSPAANVAIPSNSKASTEAPKPNQILQSKEAANLGKVLEEKKEQAKPVLKAEQKIAPVIPVQKEIKYKTLLDKCNEYSIKEDGSFLEIAVKNNQILIHDPQYKNEFVVPYEEAEFHHNANLIQFRYDDRLKIWFNKSLKELKADPETRWKIPTHRFGKAADYLMQLVGIKNPYLAKKKNNDRLVHEAKSITQKNQGHFEYTFRKEGKKLILYHRNYRPYKVKQ